MVLPGTGLVPITPTEPPSVIEPPELVAEINVTFGAVIAEPVGVVIEPLESMVIELPALELLSVNELAVLLINTFPVLAAEDGAKTVRLGVVVTIGLVLSLIAPASEVNVTV